MQFMDEVKDLEVPQELLAALARMQDLLARMDCSCRQNNTFLHSYVFFSHALGLGALNNKRENLKD
jgi:hypothetical protein